jgi:hypothetical protein
LGGIHERGASEPTRSLRQLSARKDTFQDKEKDRCQTDNQNGNHLFLTRSLPGKRYIMAPSLSWGLLVNNGGYDSFENHHGTE